MLVNNGIYDAKIVDYGINLSKETKNPYIFIDFIVEGQKLRWMGNPLTREDKGNDLFAAQLVSAGFDSEKHELDDVMKGMGSFVLEERGTVKIRVAEKPNGRGEMEWKIAWIGETMRASEDEVKQKLTAEMKSKLKFPKAKKPKTLDDFEF